LTKLGELKAAWDAAKSELNAANDKYYDAYDAYLAELEKQGENTND
jgi:hypothetical protein